MTDPIAQAAREIVTAYFAVPAMQSQSPEEVLESVSEQVIRKHLAPATWTREPDKQGWWWRRRESRSGNLPHLHEIVLVYRDSLDDDTLIARLTDKVHKPVAECAGEWCGPLLPPPVEEREE